METVFKTVWKQYATVWKQNRSSISSIYTVTKLLHKHEHFFSLETDNLNIPCLKDFPHNLRKYEIKGTSKISIFQLVDEWEKLWKYSLGFIFKNQILHLLLELGKNENSTISNIQKSQNLVVN